MMMLVLICPECNAHNPPDAESCQDCQASLAGVAPSELPDSLDSENEDFDLFEPEEKDLPDLLYSLKQDDQVEDEESLLEEFDASQPEEFPDQPEEHTPEWLDTVRKRAREEEDSVGDMIKRVSAAQGTLAGDHGESHHEDFESWIQKLREEARDKAAGQDEAPEERASGEGEAGESDPEWLSRVRKAHGSLEPPREPDAAGRSLLEWLVELEEGQEEKPPEEEDGEIAEAEVTQPIRTHGDEAAGDRTQEVRTGTTPAKETETAKAELVTVDITRDEHEQADLLATTITDERADRPTSLEKPKTAGWLVRAILALLLITGMSLALFSGSQARLPGGQLPPAGQALWDWAAELLEGASLLLVFDYQPGYAAELELIAAPILKETLAKASEVAFVSSSASGTLLAEALLTEVMEASAVPKDSFPVENWGYYPVGAFGAYGIASGLNASMQLPNLPEPTLTFPQRDYEGILILSDQFDGAQAWIEQLTILSPDTPVHLLVSAQAGPMLMPYFESGQVSGMLSGVGDAAGLESVMDQGGVVARRWRAYQVGTLSLVAMLVLGVMISLIAQPQSGRRGEV
jgi:hypothetical protein